MSLRTIKHRISNIKRLNQILGVLVKYGFGYIVDRLHIEQSRIGRKLFSMRPVRKLDIFDLPEPVRIRRALEELGPTFIKFGQILSMRPDLIPIELCLELEKLQDKISPFKYEKVEEQIKRALNRPISEIFDQFSPKPQAAASLAQVHAAKLKNGTKVVVKVQRPGIEKTIKKDIRILHELAKLADKYVEEVRVYNPIGLIDEFKKSILKEIDFTREANNIRRFRRQFASDDMVYIPNVFPELSSRQILTVERIEGIKVSNNEEIDSAGLDRHKIAINGAKAVLKMVFKHGFFHADPHPGNIFVLSDNRVAFIDFGMVGRIHKSTKAQIANMLTGVVEHDASRITNACTAIGMVDEKSNIKELELDFEDFVDRYYVESLSKLKVGQFFMDLIDSVTRNRIKVPSDLFLLGKAFAIIEGVGEKLDPSFDMVALAKPFAEELVRQKYSPRKLAKEILNFSELFYNFAISLPRELTVIIDKVKRGRLRIEFEHKGLEHLTSELDKVSNRIAFSVIIAALIVGSSIVMQTNKGPLLFEFPVFGFVGYIIAGIMGLWLAIAILRSGKL
jgi:ubiquinone biosynthesis protein